MADLGSLVFESRQAGRSVSPIHPEFVSEATQNETNETRISYEISLISYETCLTRSPNRICERPPNETRTRQERDSLSHLQTHANWTASAEVGEVKVRYMAEWHWQLQ